MKNKAREICIFILLFIVLVLFGVCVRIYQDHQEYWDIEENIEMTEDERIEKQIYELLNEGNYIEVGIIFSKGQVSQTLYQKLLFKDSKMIERVLVDAMVNFQENGQYSEIVLLRSLGYISDSMFKDYWRIVGCGILNESSSDIMYPNVDMYLLTDMERICKLDEFAFLEYVDLWQNDEITEELYDTLCRRMDSNFEIDYKELLRLIDIGNYEKIGEIMFRGELDKQLYDSMYEENKEVMNEIIFHILMSCAEDNNAIKILTLYSKGYVPSESFIRYLKAMGIKTSEDSNANNMDLLLVNELVRMISIDNNPEKLKNDLLNSNLLDVDSKKILKDLSQ